MQHEPNLRLRRRAGLILSVVAAAGIWWWLDRLGSRANWLKVEAPHRAMAGQNLPIRVHLAPLAETGYLCADLHWATTRDTPAGYLATGGAKAVGREGGTYDFAVRVQPRNGLRFVNGIIFLSRTGSWEDHTRVAVTGVIPVAANTLQNTETQLEPLRVEPLDEDSTDHPRPPAGPRLLSGLLFLAAAAVAWGAAQFRSRSREGPGANRGCWRALVMALALACLWELLGLEHWLGAQARAMARTGDFYYPRAVLQKVMISLATIVTVVFLISVRCVRSSHRLLLSCFGLYVGISAVNLLSLHAIDKIADLSWHGLTFVQALKLACAAMTLHGIREARRAPD